MKHKGRKSPCRTLSEPCVFYVHQRVCSPYKTGQVNRCEYWYLAQSELCIWGESWPCQLSNGSWYILWEWNLKKLWWILWEVSHYFLGQKFANGNFCQYIIHTCYFFGINKISEFRNRNDRSFLLFYFVS